MDGNYLTLLLILIFIHFSCGSSCYSYYTMSTQTCQSWFGWWGCKTVYLTRRRCCSGYSGSSCSEPQCRNGFGADRCNMKNEGYVKYKNGIVVSNSGGECYAPSKCRNCNKGYYPVSSLGGYCKACSRPANCNLPVCTTSGNTMCEYCVGEYIRDKPGYNIYTGKPDDRKCQRACSWKEGARCFPGICSSNMLLDIDCKCATGFGSTDCATATTAKVPTILDMHLTLQDSANDIFLVDKALNKTLFWTKTIWSNISVEAWSHYKPDIDFLKRPNYIISYNIGIETLTIDVTLSRGAYSGKWTEDGRCTNFDEICNKSLSNIATSGINPWKKILKGQFKHGDRIEFEVSTKNGGIVLYEDRSTFSRPYAQKRYFLNGIVTSEALEIRFDEYPPTHCFTQRNNCTEDALTATDFVKEPNLTVNWGGWADKDSGIGKYEFNIYYLHAMKPDGLLTYKYLLPATTVSSDQSSVTLDLNEQGPYSIEIIVYDRVGNYKIARRIMLFDNESVVNLYGSKAKVVQVQYNCWINKYSNTIEVIWPGRFRNDRHNLGGWLNRVQDTMEISRALDDCKNRSSRTVDKVVNIEGIVRFEIAYMVELNGKTTYKSFKHVPREFVILEKMVYNDEEFIDGKKLTYFIRGFDAVGEYAEDNVTAIIDVSPPIIHNLWLRKGKLINISVHSVTELNELTIEWEAFDYHSGVQEVSWKIFDNFTRNVVVHGQSREHPQGEANTLDDCKMKYRLYARGPNCYCSPYNGCFHRHFLIAPRVSTGNNGGLHLGEEIGVHDHDYFIEITVTNFAGLTSVRHKKITIDTSPPQEGTVLDGIPGYNEVDFQQSLLLAGHWYGFFDKESSVWFYTYGFSERCLTENELDIQAPRNWKVSWTYEKWAKFTTTKYWKYYLTVMAYNHALRHSKPVCSDGVIIDVMPADVSEVVVNDVVSKSGLVKSDVNDTVYILHRNRVLEEVLLPPEICRERATTVSESALALYPHKRRSDRSMSLMTLPDDCDDLQGIHSDLIAYITSDSMVELSWNVTYGAAEVHDYEVGIASENSKFPDIMNFTSSHHHQHIRLFHPAIFDGQLLYFVFKAITKSSVTDIKIVGPFVYDSKKPEFAGEITLSIDHTKTDKYIIAWWDINAFTDHGSPNVLSYEVAIGTTRNSQDILPFNSISVGGSCKELKPPSCAAISTGSLPWHLHGKQGYFVTIKVRDIVGHYVTASSREYQHNIVLASQGIVQDIGESSLQFVDIDDIDYQTSISKLRTRWSGFEHPYEDIKFTTCVSNTSSSDYMLCVRSEDMTKHTFSELDLKPYETYYHTVIAETEAGIVTAVSDGVTVVVDGDEIKGIQVFDGSLCNSSKSKYLNVTTFHHEEDKRLRCKLDVDFQASTNVLQAHWNIPVDKRHYLHDIYWAVEEKAPTNDTWKLSASYQHLGSTASYLVDSGVNLSPGRTYRISLKLCAGQYCFKPVHSDGVTVVPNPPSSRNVTLTYGENKTMLEVYLEPFKDMDIEDLSLSRKVMDHYEWAIADESVTGRLLTKWHRIIPINSLTDTFRMLHFTIFLPENIAFTQCWILTMRGYTKAGLSSTTSAKNRNCQHLQYTRPNVVIDAVGKPLSSANDNLGKGIYVGENDIWKESDKDYTPYRNVLSAVWPTLRYTQYTWAVLLIKRNQTVSYYRSKQLDSWNLCDHPDTIRCGETAQTYINVEFSIGELTHGRRYIICIHANTPTLQEQELGEIYECSNGVTVDLTPPMTADVWIGNEKQNLFQTSTSELTVYWNSFTDVEKEGYAAHVSGVTHYMVALGTSTGGVDVQPFTNVGLTNHKTFHSLKLQSGHTYFATVTAYDFTGQFSSSRSKGITIDISPPHVTRASITLPSRHISNTDFLEVCWRGVFLDAESGISHYSWAVGTHAGYDDIFLFADTDEECASTPQNKSLSLKEGHAYFVSVKAHNKARLFKAISSWAFVVDVTPPVPGEVYDGPLGTDGSSIDVDFVDNHSTLQAHWAGFHDPHSTVIEYFVNVGSCKNCEDVLKTQPVGIRTGIELKSLHLSEGLHYYVTVTACNTANLCSSVTSDGFVVDSTPPVKGTVTDGHLERDVRYQASRNYLGCKWHGFIDPQSNISHYVWRVGTTKGDDNILPPANAHTHEEAFILELRSEKKKYLPLGIRIYCTIRAYNRAGRFVEASSNGFIIDDTPPIFLNQLSLSQIGTIREGTTILRTGLKIHWDVYDSMSFIESQHLSISSHLGGDFNRSSTRVEGIVRDYTFTDLDFHDGSFYSIKLISCNGAALCTESVLTEILVDSTRPTAGAFAINTDHAAALNRQPKGWMTWNTTSLNLAWLGFEDMDSDIDAYTINVGSQYMGNDLNEEPYTPMTVIHNNDASLYDEGKVQTFAFRTQQLNRSQTIFISITAENHVGLSSFVVHSQFNLLFGGVMELVRRCDSYSCLGHCVCAPNGKMCHSKKLCNDISGKDGNNTLFEVEDYIDLRFPYNYTRPSHSPITTMLGGRWYIKTHGDATPLWYEWSVGESGHNNPQGVFDTVTDKVWHDAGQKNYIVFTVDRGRPVLTENKRYSVFVRAWYSSDVFAIFKSVGVTILHTPPVAIDIEGKGVKEVLIGSTRNVDFITRNTQIKVDWSETFRGGISRYNIYISISPGGHILHTVTKDLHPSVTSFNLTGLEYEEHTTYYTVVQAFNLAGLHTTRISDGFMLDVEPPTPGIVMDGFDLLGKHAKADTSHIQSSWRDFSDLGSGIQTYEYCVSSGVTRGTCDIKPLSPVGIATRIDFYPKVQLKQGAVVRGEVRAFDFTGKASPLVSSNGVIIDTTAPVRATSVECQPNILLDSSFEKNMLSDNNYLICDNISDLQWYLSGRTCVSFVESDTAPHGRTILQFQGSILQAVNIKMHGNYKVTFHTSTIPSSSLHLSAVEGYTQVDGIKHVFMMYSKPKTPTYAWQKHVFFFNLDTNTTAIEFGTITGHSAFAIDDIQLQLCGVTANEANEGEGHINVHTVFVHDWSSVHADWSFVDPETDILEYLWAIGTVQGGTELQPFVSVGRRTFASNKTLRLDHNTMVHITVVAINAASLRTISYSNPILIDLSRPDCRYVNDGPLVGQDLDLFNGHKLDFHWEMSDPESGIKKCSWALGKSERDTSIQDFVKVHPDQQKVKKVFQSIPEGKVYITVRCTNGAGLTRTCSSNGVKLIQTPPSVDEVILELLTSSATQYEPRGRYHGNKTEICFRWAGFKSEDGVKSFLVALNGDEITSSKIVNGSLSGYNYACFSGLSLDDGEYTISVTGINEVNVYSLETTATFVLVTIPPSHTGLPVKAAWTKETSTVTASWDYVFVSTIPLYYAVATSMDEGGEEDLVRWQETADTQIEIVLDTSEMPAAGINVRLIVRAIAYSGLFRTTHTDLFVSP